MKTSSGLPVFALLALLAGCGSNASGGASDVAAGGASTTNAPSAASSTFANAPACGATGQPLFTNALCVCDDFAQAGVLRTEASTGAASVGVNGRSAAAAGTEVGGAWVAYKGLDVAGDVSIDGDLVSTLDVSGAGVLSVGHDLSVGGSFLFMGALKVGGTLRAANALPIGYADIGASGPYTAPSAPPCGCDRSQVLDVGAAIAAAAAKNDNTANGLSSDGLDILGLGKIHLKTGTYYVADGMRIGKGTIIVDGAVKLFVGKSLLEIGMDTIELSPGATLDLFVEGVVANAGLVGFGDGLRPEAFRLYMGGAGTVAVSAGVQRFDGLVYAPGAHIAFAGLTQVHGALFAKDVAWGGVLDIIYAGDSGASATTSCSPSNTPPSNPPATSNPPSSGIK